MSYRGRLPTYTRVDPSYALDIDLVSKIDRKYDAVRGSLLFND